MVLNTCVFVCVCVCVTPQMTLPWGSLSSLKLDCRSQSDDGPIMWVRPGEQMVPTADMPKSPFKRRRYPPGFKRKYLK